MFNQNDFQKIDPALYKIIRKSEYDIEIQSLVTGHYWLFRSYDSFVMLFHKYFKQHDYHKQMNPISTFNIALKFATKHDEEFESKKTARA